MMRLMLRHAHGNRIVLAVDVGGSHVKALARGRAAAPLRVRAGPHGRADGRRRPARLADGWAWDASRSASRRPSRGGTLVAEPVNLGDGWVGFDYEAAFGKPTKVVNDAAMQALGSYEGGRMLFLGLGTGLGSALIVDGVVEPLELGHLPYRKETFEDYVGERGARAARQEAVAEGGRRGRRAARRRRWSPTTSSSAAATRRARRAAARTPARRQRERVPRRLPALGSRLVGPIPLSGWPWPGRAVAPSASRRRAAGAVRRSTPVSESIAPVAAAPRDTLGVVVRSGACSGGRGVHGRKVTPQRSSRITTRLLVSRTGTKPAA